MEFLLLAAIFIIAVLGLTLQSARHEKRYHLPEEELLRSVDAMHKYGHDQEAVCLLQEYSNYYPNSVPVREKLQQYEIFCQKNHSLHSRPKGR